MTGNLHERVAQHREGRGSEFVKKYGLTRLVWWEQHDTVVSAIQRETSIKRWKRDWKIDLINEINPKWLDLATSGGMP